MSQSKTGFLTPLEHRLFLSSLCLFCSLPGELPASGLHGLLDPFRPDCLPPSRALPSVCSLRLHPVSSSSFFSPRPPLPMFPHGRNSNEATGPTLVRSPSQTHWTPLLPIFS